MEQELLSLARNAIETFLKTGDRIEYPHNNEFLKDKGATFVTLTMDEELRGCIGSLLAYRSLGEDIIENSIAAAVKDSRFLPLNLTELPFIKIEISLLSVPLPVEYSSLEELVKMIEPLKDGVIFKHGYKQSTFLPQVWEQLPTHDQFFIHLLHKGGFNPKDLNECRVEVYKYSVKKIKER